MRTLDQRVAPFDWCELESNTEYYSLPRSVESEQLAREYNAMLELLFPDGDYDDSYDHLPMWEASRVPAQPWGDREDKRLTIKTKRNAKFPSKTKENK